MYQIGVAAERSGVMIETIRYYEREGIVPKPDRLASGRRVYTDDEIARLRFVKRCRDLGFPIPEAKSLLGLTDGSQASCASAKMIAENHLLEVRVKIAALSKLELALVEMTIQCSDNNKQCPVLDQLLAD